MEKVQSGFTARERAILLDLLRDCAEKLDVLGVEFGRLGLAPLKKQAADLEVAIARLALRAGRRIAPGMSYREC